MKRRIFSVLLSSASVADGARRLRARGEADPSGSPSDAESETATRDELIFVNYRDIRDLNPHLYAGEMYAQSILYDTLVSNTEDGYVGCLAEDWTISDDGRIYTFNIRDGVTFSDGTPLRRQRHSGQLQRDSGKPGAAHLAGDDEPAGERFGAGQRYFCH